MPCNPDNPKAHDPKYKCNPQTNRWIKKKSEKVAKTKTVVVKQKTVVINIVGNCNPQNPKAQDANYECNPRTNRWVKKKNFLGTKTKIMTVKQKSIDDREIKQNIIQLNPFLLDIPNIYNRPLADIISLVENVYQQKTKTKTKNKTKTKTKKEPWEKRCKRMEETCPMETDLSGDNWCSLSQDKVFYYEKDGKFYCYGVEEVFSIIHMGFTARDTSYEVPPLRFQLPRDSYNRTPFSKDFFVAFTKHIKKNSSPIPKEPEVCYFLKYFSEFYDDPQVRNLLPQSNPNKVELSETIDRFLMRHQHIDINLNTSKWFWLQGKKPDNLQRYLFS